MSRNKFLLLAIAVALHIGPRTALAMDAATDMAQATQVVQQGGLELGATFEKPMVLGEPIVVLLSIRNVGTSTMTLQNLKLEPIGLLSNVYTKSCMVSLSDQTIRSQESVNRTCLLPAGPVPAEVFLYSQNRYRALANVKVASRQDPLPMVLNLRLAMPELAVIFGAFVGTMLLVLFSTSFSFLQTLPQAPVDLSTLKKQTLTYLARLPIRVVLSAVEMVLRAVQGGVVAIILIVLSRSTIEIGAPIAVNVDDFWGGLLVGIFSVPLASWLATKMELSNNHPSVSVQIADDSSTTTPPVR